MAPGEFLVSDCSLETSWKVACVWAFGGVAWCGQVVVVEWMYNRIDRQRFSDGG